MCSGWLYHSLTPNSTKGSYGDGGSCSWCSFASDRGTTGSISYKNWGCMIWNYLAIHWETTVSTLKGQKHFPHSVFKVFKSNRLCPYPPPPTAEYTLFSIAHGTFFRKDHMLGQIQLSIDWKKLRFTKYLLWPQRNKAGNNNKKKTGKVTSTWKSNNTLLTNESKKSLRKLRKIETNEKEKTICQNYGI